MLQWEHSGYLKVARGMFWLLNNSDNGEYLEKKHPKKKGIKTQ